MHNVKKKFMLIMCHIYCQHQMRPSCVPAGGIEGVFAEESLGAVHHAEDEERAVEYMPHIIK